MTVKCSAKQIADFIALWGMTGTYSEFCEHAEDARGLKSLDLIISTLKVFVEAFCFSFEDIYSKYKVNFSLSEEKFIEFLKPRCLLMTKDNKCFNFMLVCAFVHEIINSFSNYNKCFHLVKAASKCLAAILNYRFKKIFETDSEWEKLMSFCIRILGLVYPPEENESDGNLFAGVSTDKMGASMTQGSAELSVEKYAIDNIDSGTKTPDKIFNISLNTNLTTETEGQKFENLRRSASACVPHPLQIPDQRSSLKLEMKVENDSPEENSKVYVTGPSLLNLAENLTDIVDDKVAIKNDGDNGGLDPICNLESASSTSTSHAFQMEGEDFSPKEESEGNEKVVYECNTCKGNENVTDSLLPDSDQEFTKIPIEKRAMNKNEKCKCTEMLGQTRGRKKLTFPFDKDSSIQNKAKISERLCNMESVSSAYKSHAFHLEEMEFYSKSEPEDSKKPFHVHYMPADKVCARITDNPEHLSEIMNLLKRCEDIEPNFFSQDEYNIPISDSEEDETSSSPSESPTQSDQKNFESCFKTIVLDQNIKMVHSVKRILREDIDSDDKSDPKESGGEPLHERSDEVVYVYDNWILESKDPPCSICDSRKINFFDVCVNNFATKYFNNHQVTDILWLDFPDDSEE